MNITDAAYATVHDYPGGSVSLSPRLGICEEWIHIGWGRGWPLTTAAISALAVGGSRRRQTGR